ncbi:hypothetical protein [Kitasatospora cheerisanensis]|uniref:Secreted protein n=1 Tax=Kitasatospora cheerisanensis KCTC 2395 TaxID=1348663 RepID=A0A066Z0E8_9ACTN|nr:hypothetical protein [Kitasatospora cheerisanensis]KDN86987.1 hypothetical protein KCH_10720 [Kitasatospora cheerisanensis KCTC 2395]
MKTAARGTLLVTAPLFAAAPMMVDASARFEAFVPTVDATCVLHAHRAAAGGAHRADTSTTTGTVTCLDAAGAPGLTGTFEPAAVPADACTGDGYGDEYGDGTAIRWSDGTASTLRFADPEPTRVGGTASLVVNGRVTDESSRFPADTVHAVGTSSATGCGTPAGATALDSTLVLRLTH